MQMVLGNVNMMTYHWTTMMHFINNDNYTNASTCMHC